MSGAPAKRLKSEGRRGAPTPLDVARAARAPRLPSIVVAGGADPGDRCIQASNTGVGAPGYNDKRTFCHTRGFTLLEILIALAVSAIVLLAIQTVFFGALRLHRTTTEQLNASLSLERTLSTVRHDIDGLMVPGSVLAGSLQTTPTSTLTDDHFGDRISPDFYTSSGKIDGWNPFADVQMVTYYLTPATDGSGNKNLLRAVTRNLLPAQETTSEAQTLLEGVAQATFTFFDGTQWTDTWDSTATSTLPSAIKLSVVLAAQAGQATPDPIELVLPVLVQTTTSQTEAGSTGAMP